MEKLSAINSTGNQSLKAICGNLKQDYLATLAWSQQKHFWPFYLYWLVRLMYSGLSLCVYAFVLDPADGTAEMSAMHARQLLSPLVIIANFLAFLTLLQCPYFLILKKYGPALQAAIYFAVIYLILPFYLYFELQMHGWLTHVMMCPETGVRAAFCK